MRELDELLLSYLTDQYPETGEDDKQAFRALLELSDPSLIEYLLQRVKPDSEPTARVVNNILNRNSV
jgi:succinate dehydrogenase flavin-adding protein (antitoxin of CptAB toxin-antitoxin module)